MFDGSIALSSWVISTQICSVSYLYIGNSIAVVIKLITVTTVVLRYTSRPTLNMRFR